MHHVKLRYHRTGPMTFILLGDPTLLLILSNAEWSGKIECKVGNNGKKLPRSRQSAVWYVWHPSFWGIIAPFLHHTPCGCAERYSLQQWFSTSDDFAWQGTLGNVWRDSDYHN